jgi:hypothetical protein
MGEKSKTNVRIRLTNSRIILIAALIIAFGAGVTYQLFIPKPVTSVQYDSFILNFRQDLNEAKKVPVRPSEDVLYRDLMNGLVENVTIVFEPVNGGDSLYGVEAFEIAYKLKLGYLVRGINPGFNAINVTSYENLPGKIQNPIIALVHPAYANETSVSIDGHVVTIKGKTAKDLDLATEKFLMVTLGIEV